MTIGFTLVAVMDKAGSPFTQSGNFSLAGFANDSISCHKDVFIYELTPVFQNVENRPQGLWF